MKKLLLLGAFVLTATFFAYPQTKDPLDSLVVCKDTQKLLLENAFVRVIDDVIPAGGTEAMHRHKHGVVIYLTDYTAEAMNADGTKNGGQRKAGAATWAEAVVHQVKNTGKTASHAIRIELK